MDKMCPIPYTEEMQKQILNYHNMVRGKVNPTATNMEKTVSFYFSFIVAYFAFNMVILFIHLMWDFLVLTFCKITAIKIGPVMCNNQIDKQSEHLITN